MTCQDSLEKLESRDLTDWAGLADDCTPAAIASFTGETLSSSPPTGRRGEKRNRASIATLPFPGYQKGAQLWYRGDDIVCLVFKHPALANTEELTKSLGEPAAKLDAYHGVALRKEGLHVYPERGIALFLSRAGDNVIRFEVFPPTDLATYHAAIYHLDQRREHPVP